MRLIVVLLFLCGPLSAAELTLSFALRWQGAAVSIPSKNLLNDSGQSVRLTRFSALISGVILHRADGSAVQHDGQYGFIDAETNRLTVPLHNVPAGEYTTIEFQLGLPPAVNHADPGRWPAGHPLNPIVDGLHWGWSGGYVFVALEGRWSTAGGEPERGFSYHLATDARRMRIRFTSLFHVGESTTIDLALDLGKTLFAQRFVPGDGSETTHSGSGDELASRLAAALERSFFFLETRNLETVFVGEALRPGQVTPSGRIDPSVTTATPLAFALPPGFPQPELPADNPLTIEGVALGEGLFNDRRLSARQRQSCATCHREGLAFSDGQAFSTGADGIQGTRSSMPLFNLAWSPAYTWDGAKARVRDQALAAMTNPTEMHADLAVVLPTLWKDETLRTKFTAAFGSPEITAERLALALEQYLLTLTSGDSKLDRAVRGEAQLSEDEKRGFELFLSEYDPARGRRGGDCFHCHGGALFTDFGYKDNGISRLLGDGGRGAINGRETDRGKFKTPSLRNVALTAPYMHDGRFGTLDAVVAHYDHGLVRTASLDPNLAKHPDEGLQLSEAEQRALVAFLKALTDSRFE